MHLNLIIPVLDIDVDTASLGAETIVYYVCAIVSVLEEMESHSFGLTRQSTGSLCASGK